MAAYVGKPKSKPVKYLKVTKSKPKDKQSQTASHALNYKVFPFFATTPLLYPGPELGKPFAAVTGTRKVVLQRISTRAKN